MTKDKAKTKAKRANDKDRARPSRPEDPDTQRLGRTARLLRVGTMPAVAAMVSEAEDKRGGSETEAALRRATDARERDDKDA